MKPNLNFGTGPDRLVNHARRTSKRSSLADAFLKRVREALNSKFSGLSHAQRRLVRLAINEAEAIAWTTPYPHLVFPALAEEKIATLIAWEERQSLLQRSGPVLTLAV